MAEWAAVIIAGVGLIGAVTAALIRVSVAVSGNTQAVNTLSEFLERQDARMSRHGEKLDDHEARIVEIETIHKVRGCAEAGL